jgi:protein phosphatase
MMDNPAVDWRKATLNYIVSAIHGLGKRAEQQDSYGVEFIEKSEVYEAGAMIALVADGIGGLKNGKEASELAISSMKRAFHIFDNEKSIEEQLINAVKATNAFVFEKYHESAGTTLAACIIEKDHLCYAGIGDSSVVLMRDSALHEINQPQNILFEDYAAELYLGSADPSTANRDPQRRALTGFIGMEDLKTVDCFRKPLPLQDGDVLLLCSDGVSSYLDEGEILDCLKQKDPKSACDRIAEYLKKEDAQTQDNYTALVIYCRSVNDN